MNMKYLVIDLEEPDNGCEGFMPGEEPMVTLTLKDEDGNTSKVRVPDVEAYRLGWDTGSVIESEELNMFESVC